MTFNSIDFAVFMPVVFFIYWALSKNLKMQNIFLLVASYFFYVWWDWRYLSLILLCTAVNYIAGLLLMKTEVQKWRKTILVICCFICFGVLGVFKYYNFFVHTFVDAFSLFGVKLQAHTLNLILPVGISFYTFHTLSYTIDVYRRHFSSTKDIISFALFVSIFPLAMAGPIERATNLLPQIYVKRKFDYSQTVDGMRQILWGLFKKIVIADSCAEIVNYVFANYNILPGSSLLIGALFFTFQIYGDFSGYSDMAIGIGKLLGFKFLRNFNYPYFSRDIAEFWRRWHMSLTTWFRDYLYIPLGGSRASKRKIVRNTFIIYLVSGFWHGANWTFIVWGLYHALLFVPLIVTGRNRKYTNAVAEGKLFPGIKETGQIFLTFFLVMIGWIFFRANTISEATEYLNGMLQFDTLKAFYRIASYPVFWICCAMLIIEWFGRQEQCALFKFGKEWNKGVRWSFYYILIGIIFYFAQIGGIQTFIYFQF
ncbi:MAG: MBOAT family protein [Candidatus Azobacteroides sp.]|nr:MBOAT family protein [Candidatus Azobacteroides sp.]